MDTGWRVAVATVVAVVGIVLVSGLATAYLFRPPAPTTTASETP
jgi:hypothetical protein